MCSAVRVLMAETDNVPPILSQERIRIDIFFGTIRPRMRETFLPFHKSVKSRLAERDVTYCVAGVE